jgi:hypothetical protein
MIFPAPLSRLICVTHYWGPEERLENRAQDYQDR